MRPKRIHTKVLVHARKEGFVVVGTGGQSELRTVEARRGRDKQLAGAKRLTAQSVALKHQLAGADIVGNVDLKIEHKHVT